MDSVAIFLDRMTDLNEDDALNVILNEFPDISPPQSLLSKYRKNVFDQTNIFYVEDCLDESSLHPLDMFPVNSDTNPSEFPSELNENEDQTLYTPRTTSDLVIQQAASFSTSPRGLQIIAQPICSAEIKYRSDYTGTLKRRGALINKNPDSSFTGPAVSISPEYLDLTQQYFIGVSLITPMHGGTQCYYLHPYELESIDHPDYNDRPNNIVWYPIGTEDQNGSKSFPDLCIVRKKEDELKEYGNLHRFPIQNGNLLNNNTQNVLSKRKIVPEYNLKQAHLAFFIGQRIDPTDKFPTMIESNRIELSKLMILVPDSSTKTENEPTDSSPKSNPPLSPPCNVDQYAPRYGYTEGNDLMLVFLTRKPNERINGKIQITFQSSTSNPEWSVTIDTAAIKVKEQMVSFRTPQFTQPISTSTRVNVILRQKEEIIGTLEYLYIPKSQCVTCQRSITDTQELFSPINSSKRSRWVAQMYCGERDAVVPLSPGIHNFQSTISVPESNSSTTTPEPLSASTTPTNAHENKLNEILHKSIESLFINNDNKPLFRIFKPSIQKNPELLYTAIDKNFSDPVSKFIPVAGPDLMHKRNQQGETALLQAVRLNRIQIVQAALGRKEADELLEDTDDKKHNIFHILALNTNSDELLDLIIDYLLKQSTDIFKKFDQRDEDNYTPLQLAILKSNLPVTRRLLKYFNTTISNDTDENLIHLAVRHSDLSMLKYLLTEGDLIEQGNQTSLTMTPLELAQSLNRVDMVNYLKELYPKPETTEEENSDND